MLTAIDGGLAAAAGRVGSDTGDMSPSCHARQGATEPGPAMVRVGGVALVASSESKAAAEADGIDVAGKLFVLTDRGGRFFC